MSKNSKPRLKKSEIQVADSTKLVVVQDSFMTEITVFNEGKFEQRYVVFNEELDPQIQSVLDKENSHGL